MINQNDEDLIQPSMIGFAKTRDWENLMSRARAHPDEVHASANRGKLSESVLHWACFHNCPTEVIEILLEIDPEALCSRDQFYQTPLHIICAKDMLACQPAESLRWLQNLVKNIHCIVDIDPSTVSAKDSKAMTPYEVLWSKFQRFNCDKENQNCGRVREISFVVFELMTFMLITVASNKEIASIPMNLKGSEKRRYILHIALDKRTFWSRRQLKVSFINFASKMDPALAKQELITCGRTFYPIYRVLNEQWAFCINQHTKEENEIKDEVLSISPLIKAFPQVASIRYHASGQHLLFVALHAGYTWSNGIDALVKAFPPALRAESVTKYNAFHIAASRKKADLDTIFHLIREDPSTILI